MQALRLAIFLGGILPAGALYTGSLQEQDEYFAILPSGTLNLPQVQLTRALFLVNAAQAQAAQEILDDVLRSVPVGQEVDLVDSMAYMLLEVAVGAGEIGVVQRFYDAMQARPRGRSLLATGTCMPRTLGLAAALLRQPEEARRHLEGALSFCERIRHRPEIALCHLDLAELLLEHYPDERDAAIEHLDFAIAECREMKMQPSVERVLRHRGLLGA